MTKGEAKALETDVVIFPLKFSQVEKGMILSEQTTEQFVVGKEPNKDNLTIRFARLKKSLRKRSVSIL